MSGLKVWDHLGCTAEVEMELTTLGTFVHTVRYGHLNRLPPDNVTPVCLNDIVIIRLSQVVVRRWFEMGIFVVLCGMYRNPTLALRAMARLTEVDCDKTCVEWVLIEHERSKFIF